MRVKSRVVFLDTYEDDPGHLKRELLWAVNDLRFQWARSGGGEANFTINLTYDWGGRNGRALLLRMTEAIRLPEMIGGAYGRY